MGYSMATPIKSKAAHTKMMAFAREHFKPWHKVTPEEGGFPADYDWTQFVSDDLSYDHKKNRLGFDFTTSIGHIGEYGKAFLRWMALQSGRTRALPKYTGTAELVPYTVYDGQEAWPVLVRSQWEARCPEDSQWCLTDEFGFKPIRRPWFPIERDPRGVETAVVIADAPNISGHKPVIRELLLKFKATREQVDELFAEGAPPYRVLSTDPHALFYLGDSLGKAGVAYSFEYGPFVLDGHRKEMADCEEPVYQQVEAVIQAELRRLTELWSCR